MDIIFVEPEETDQTVQIGAYIYRKNSGEDINITSLTFKNSLLAARTLMVPENYMICILRNGERVRRWDREILAGSNRWYKCSPDNFEILGKLPIINKVTTLIKS
ncbi:hypothetical protein ACMB9U_005447 [Escherichia coli]|uniref:type IV pilus biogenesis protein PilI n=2 Tax=Escherichia coli TaxID=562 RepID=UPI00067BDB59|nr:hypothetical protein [Escherichia coli]EMC9150002.1 hypothetical protein [Shigella sonnei]EER8432577.1 hypothetical protein [Escherichia coli]EES5067899.1 hypothetical protein [Escherichia coli]EET0867212.1 hypothetical protein [Escherichia coli]EET5628060.1 hypothetical protein [Escherichia coli]